MDERVEVLLMGIRGAEGMAILRESEQSDLVVGQPRGMGLAHSLLLEAGVQVCSTGVRRTPRSGNMVRWTGEEEP